MIYRLTWKEIYRNRKYSILTILCLTIGYLGFSIVNGFRESFEASLNAQSQNYLGADLRISARRPIIEAELAAIKEKLKVTTYQQTEVKGMYSMVYANEQSRLVEIKAIQENFPLIGHMTTDFKEKFTFKQMPDFFQKSWILVYPEILHQLGVSVGDSLKIGQESYLIKGVIEQDIGASVIGVSMAPRIYMSLDSIEKTELLTKGSVSWHQILLLFDDFQSSKWGQILYRALDDPDIRVATHRGANQQSARLLDYLFDFLGIMSIVGILLTMIASTYLYQIYFSQKLKNSAILLSLGASHRFVVKSFLLHMILINIISSGMSLGLAQLLFKIFPGLFSELLGYSIPLSLTLASIVKVVAVIFFCSFLSLLPWLLYIIKKPTFDLFHELKKDISLNHPAIIFSWIVGIWSFCVWQANSWLTANYFVAALSLSLALFYTLSRLWFRILERFKWQNVPLRYAILYLSRNKWSSSILFISLALAATLLTTVNQVRMGLQNELQRPDKSKIPDLFLFDIQPEDLDDLRQLLSKNNIALDIPRPMIRSRLIKVNGEEYKKPEWIEQEFSREKQRENRSKNRGYNLSFADRLHPGENIIAGKPFPKDAGNSNYISVEEGFAKRLHIGINDELTFLVSGVEITGTVINLRKVRWTTFKPNFFLVFNQGELSEAPHIYLASLSNLADQKNQIQAAIVKKFPHISMVDVSRLSQNLFTLIGRLSTVVILMSLIVLLVGLFTFYMISLFEAEKKKQHSALFILMGAPRKFMEKTVIYEFLLLSTSAILLGTILATFTAMGLSWSVFDQIWPIPYQFLAIQSLLLITMIVLLGWLSQRKQLRKQRN